MSSCECSGRFGDLLIRQVLKDAQIDAQRAHPGAVLRRRAHPGREAPGRDVPAPTAPPGGDVLDDAQQRALGQIEHLTALAAHQRPGVGQIAVAAPHRSGGCSTRSSGVATGSRRAPSCPSWPPCLRPDERRRLRFFEPTAGLASPSADGGRDELRELALTRASSSPIRASCSTIRACNRAINAA